MIAKLINCFRKTNKQPCEHVTSLSHWLQENDLSTHGSQDRLQIYCRICKRSVIVQLENQV
jgi:hypothetical protein